MHKISKKRGIIKVPREFYNSNIIDLSFEALKIKVYNIDFCPFNDVYTIHIVSPFLPEIEEGTTIPNYNIEVLDMGIQFIKVNEYWEKI